MTDIIDLNEARKNRQPIAELPPLTEWQQHLLKHFADGG